MNRAVEEALEKAAMALCKENRHDRCPCAEASFDQRACGWMRGSASRAIVAFLRALPERLVEASPEGGLVAISAHTLAATVARAGDGGGDG